MTSTFPKDSSLEEANKVFRSLSHQYRRSALQILQQTPNMTLSDLAAQIGGRKHDKPIDGLTPQEISRIKAELYHNHIPKLIEAELVEFTDAENVTIADQTTVDTYIDLLKQFN